MQVLINSVVSAAEIALLGLGFSLIYRTSGILHFAHGIVFTAGAYAVFLFSSWWGLPLPVSVILAAIASALAGSLMEMIVYRPLRRKHSPALVVLLASFGIYVVMQNLLSVVFGDDTKVVRAGAPSEGLALLGARVTPVQVLILSVSVILLGAFPVLLRGTKAGQAMRAVESDGDLAAAAGISTDRVMLCAFCIGSALAGLGGALVGIDLDITPTMGMKALMMALVAVTIGGAGSIAGLALGALLLGLTQNLSPWILSSQWQDALSFAILLAFLLLRPEGFLGRKTKSATL